MRNNPGDDLLSHKVALAVPNEPLFNIQRHEQGLLDEIAFLQASHFQKVLEQARLDRLAAMNRD